MPDQSPDYSYIPTTPLTSSYTYATPVPKCCSSEPVILGVDEAGRGPVLGPMVYGISYIPVSKKDSLKSLGVDDSKALTDDIRRELLCKIQQADWIGWSIHVGSPQDISSGMLRASKYNLNAQAHDTTINLIKLALESGVNVNEIYVDTVGPPDHYRLKLLSHFPGKKITVTKKADSLFPVVSAASICAKVSRDYIVENWRFVEEGVSFANDYGSGYPGDGKTVSWLKNHVDRFFAFPRWQTTEKLMQDECVSIVWHDQLVSKEGADIRKFFGKKRARTNEDEEEAMVIKVETGRESWLKDVMGLDLVSKI